MSNINDDLYASAFGDGGTAPNDETYHGNPAVGVEVATSSSKVVVSPASFADEIVRKFVLAFEKNFRDGSLSAKYKTRADALGTPIPSPGTSKVASPASQQAPFLSETGGVKERFSFPWARLAKILWVDEIGDTVNVEFLGDEFVDFDSVISAVQQSSATLLKATPRQLNALASQINRTYMQGAEMLSDILVAPCLADVVVDRIIPHIRFAMYDSCIHEAEISEDVKLRQAQMMLGALHDLCMTWLHGFVPWLTHVCRLHKEEKLLCARAQSFPRQFKSEIAASIRHVANKRDLQCEEKGGVFAKSVLIPLSWVESLETWLEVNDDAVMPPPLRTWKLAAQDFTTAELELNPRKESKDVTKDSVVASIPESLFTFLWERFGGGPKLLVSEQRCPILDRFHKLPVDTAVVSVRVSPLTVRQLESSENQKDAKSRTNSDASPVILLGDMPQHTLICDVMAAATHVVNQLFPDATPQQENLLLRCLLYGHCIVTIEHAVVESEELAKKVEIKQTDSLSSLIEYAKGLSDSSNLRQVGGAVLITVAALRMTDKPFGQCGLDNLGNTCFMNSGLQCLSNLPKFRRAMLGEQFTRDAPPERVPLVLQFTKLIRDLWRGEIEGASHSIYPRNSVCPSGFKKEIGAQCSRFSGYEQQDAIEFIEVLLDRLHDELNPVIGKRFRERHDDDAKIDVRQLSDIYWKDYFNNNNTLVTQLFYRQERTRFECLTCGHKTTVFDAQSSLPVPVGEEQYVSVDVTVFFNRLDALAGTAVTDAVEQHHRPHNAQDTELSTTRYDRDRLALRVRVPVDSAHSVVLSEVRHILAEGKFIGKSESKTVLMFYQREVPRNWVSSHSQISRPTVRRHDTSEFLAVFIPSYQPVLDRVEAVKQAGAKAGVADTTAATTVPSAPPPQQSITFGVGGTRQSQNAVELGLDLFVRVMFFVDKCSSPTLVSYVRRAETTNQDLWRMAERVFAAVTEEPPRKEEGHKPAQPVLAHPTTHDEEAALADSPNESERPALQNDENEEANAHNAGLKRGFSLLVSRTCSDALDAVPLDDEPFPFPLFTTYEAVTLRFFILVAEPHVTKPHLPPVEHETRRTVISNEAADLRAAHDSGLTLEKALANMCETHVLKGDDSWYCPSCKEHRESVTESAQFILPPILTIHLKRFKASIYGTMNKIETPVLFPLVLDMKPFMASDEDDDNDDMDGDDDTQQEGVDRPKHKANQRCQRTDAVYTLCGVVYHSGSLSFGHYTAQAFCEGAAEWVYYNDSSAYPTKAPPHPEGAYILFYQRREQQQQSDVNDVDATLRPVPLHSGGGFTRPAGTEESDGNHRGALDVATAPTTEEGCEEKSAASFPYSGIDSPD